MRTFLKTQISSLLATLVDFTATICFVEIAGLHYLVEATLLGAVSGACTNFLINKYWSFAHKGSIRQQGLKYALVWTGSVLLNTFGVYILTRLAGLNYIVSKLIVSVLVGITFNYTLQRHYVFARHEKILSK